jgi:hypothetical protein
MDWKNIVNSLEQHGLSRAEIASKCACSLSLINALALGARGGRLSYEIGAALLALLSRLDKQARRKAA